jgi:hypothetical protein
VKPEACRLPKMNLVRLWKPCNEKFPEAVFFTGSLDYFISDGFSGWDILTLWVLTPYNVSFPVPVSLAVLHFYCSLSYEPF